MVSPPYLKRRVSALPCSSSVDNETDPGAGIENLGMKFESHDAEAMAKSDGDQQKMRSPPPTPKFKRHKGCSFCILDVVNTPIPVFPPSQVVVGVITMEDVIEELLQVCRHGLSIYIDLLWFQIQYCLVI